MAKIVVFSNGQETIICTKKKRNEAIKKYFFEGSGRDLDDYDEEEYNEAISIDTRSVVNY